MKSPLPPSSHTTPGQAGNPLAHQPNAAGADDKPTFSLCVFCGSRLGTEAAYVQAAEHTGRWLAQQNAQLVYGGGHNGLMGRLADAALSQSGRVIGIIPKALVELESAHTGCTELRVVDDMHQRKQGMANQADAFLVLPGGIGTFEEFFEVWTWKQLAYHAKPIGLLNLNGYYDELLRFLSHCVSQGFMGQFQMDLICVDNDLDRLLNRLKADVLSSQLIS